SDWKREAARSMPRTARQRSEFRRKAQYGGRLARVFAVTVGIETAVGIGIHVGQGYRKAIKLSAQAQAPVRVGTVVHVPDVLMPDMRIQVNSPEASGKRQAEVIVLAVTAVRCSKQITQRVRILK